MAKAQNYRNLSDEVKDKISALGDTAIPNIAIPVLLGVDLKNITPNFGVPRSGGRTHEGEDIMSPRGVPIISPTAAVVVKTGVGPSEGINVYTANPGGETFVYLHLDRLGEGVVPGALLQQGSLIGYVGYTGNAVASAPHLHFEIQNSSGVSMDPYPRIKTELTLQEKMTYLSTILAQTTDPNLAEFLATKFRSTFNAAYAANIALPPQIASIIGVTTIMPAVAPTTTPTVITTAEVTSAGDVNTRAMPAEDLKLGSKGSAVIALQKYLIAAASGNEAVRLIAAGANGNFGPVTKAALIEFQKKVGISPASGYYGPKTRAYIESHALTTEIQPAQTVVTSTKTDTQLMTLTRTLQKGMSGEDVRTLQKLLNSKGFTVAPSGIGSPGNETTYFGAATQAAVIKFQIAQKISPTAGLVGPATRAALSL
jgi:peptidoglycan hydrolase-like protein with peptidoglycan-binding domain